MQLLEPVLGKQMQEWSIGQVNMDQGIWERNGEMTVKEKKERNYETEHDI